MENTSLIMKKSHELFLASTTLLLYTIKTNINDNSKQIKKNTDKFYDALVTQKFTVEDIGDFIKKTFTVISGNITLLKSQDVKLFQLRESKNNKLIRVTILPGIDLNEAYNLLNDNAKTLLWKYVKSLYIAASKLVLLVNKTGISEDIVRKTSELSSNFNQQEIFSVFHTTFPNSTLIDKEDFDPFIGVGTNNGDGFSVNDIVNVSKSIDTNQSSDPGIGSMLKMVGVDKMINLDDLSNQLKNINQQDITEATENIKKLLGNNIDEGTSEMIGIMLNDITNELKTDNLTKGDPINNIVKIAETVAKNMLPKIDPKKVDMNKVWASTQNMAKNYVDDKGNKVFQGGNPLSMLTNLMESQMNNSNKFSSKQPTNEQYVKECEDIFKKMGMSNMDMKKLKNMDISKIMSNIDSAGNISATDTTRSKK